MAWEHLAADLAELFEEAAAQGQRFAREERTLGPDQHGVRIVGAPFPRPVQRERFGRVRPDAICCPRCGALRPVRGTGNLPVWCGDRCRVRAQYEERREAALASELRTGHARRIESAVAGRIPAVPAVVYVRQCARTGCGSAFESKRRQARYCSRRCAERAQTDAASRSPLRSAASYAAELRWQHRILLSERHRVAQLDS